MITALHDLVAEYPLVEPLEGLLMRALHAAGRDAEAIDRYTVVRQRLADNLELPVESIEEAFGLFQQRGLMFLDAPLALALALPAVAGR